jgi:hypothetical protein
MPLLSRKYRRTNVSFTAHHLHAPSSLSLFSLLFLVLCVDPQE